jgi:hypothetical protein
MLLSSYEIVAEFRKRHGAGQFFFRTDGLQQEERRAALRRRFLEAYPGITAGHRAAILRAAVTPGMTRGEMTAAWGLLEEDTRNVYGHVVDAGHTAYAYFTGFGVGAGYGLYMLDDVVAGVRETDELVEPHARETDMKLADRYLDLFCYYEMEDGELLGADMDEYRNPPDILLMAGQRRELIPHLSADEAALKKLEFRMVGHGVYGDYLAELRRMGTDDVRATPAERCAAAIAVKRPYIGWLFSMP